MTTAKAATPFRPNLMLLNSRLVFVSESPAIPVPENVTCCGLVEALSLSVSVALSRLGALGANVTPSVHNVLGARVIGSRPQVPVPLGL